MKYSGIGDVYKRPQLNKMERRPRIGIVGEIYVKFSPIASNDIVRSIEANGGEAETSGMLDFFLYGLLDSHFQWKHLDGTFSDNLKDTFGRYLLEWYPPSGKSSQNFQTFPRDYQYHAAGQTSRPVPLSRQPRRRRMVPHR